VRRSVIRSAREIRIGGSSPLCLLASCGILASLHSTVRGSGPIDETDVGHRENEVGSVWMKARAVQNPLGCMKRVLRKTAAANVIEAMQMDRINALVSPNRPMMDAKMTGDAADAMKLGAINLPANAP